MNAKKGDILIISFRKGEARLNKSPNHQITKSFI